MNIVFATNNQHKLQEFRQIVGDSLNVLSLNDIGFHEDIPETADTLEGNALLKAREIYARCGVNCIADDTGLEVEALGGAPGVMSARYAPGLGHDAEANMRLLLKNLEGVGDRRARFRTVMVLIINGREEVFDGIVEGEITLRPEGEGGFGYDPVFKPVGWAKTFGEATAEEKNAVSHRARATQKLVNSLLKEINTTNE